MKTAYLEASEPDKISLCPRLYRPQGKGGGEGGRGKAEESMTKRVGDWHCVRPRVGLGL